MQERPALGCYLSSSRCRAPPLPAFLPQHSGWASRPSRLSPTPHAALPPPHPLLAPPRIRQRKNNCQTAALPIAHVWPAYKGAMAQPRAGKVQTSLCFHPTATYSAICPASHVTVTFERGGKLGRSGQETRNAWKKGAARAAKAGAELSRRPAQPNWPSLARSSGSQALAG